MAEPAEQNGQGGLSQHEAGRIVLARHRSDALLQFGRPVRTNAGATLIRHRRIRPVGRQLQAVRDSRKGLVPVGELAGDQTAVISQITELLALPQRVIDVLNRQFSPGGCHTSAAEKIGHAQVPHQRRDGQSVGRDVMRYGHHHMFVIGDPEKPCLHGDLCGQIKGMARHCADRLIQLGARPAAGVDDIPAKVGVLRGNHHLLRDAVDGGERGAKALMSAHHIGQRRSQRLSIERAVQAQPERHVVRRRRPL